MMQLVIIYLNYLLCLSQVQNSILFLKLVNKKTSVSKQLDKAELEKNLINRKTNELFNLYSKSHLSKLKNTSFIEYR